MANAVCNFECLGNTDCDGTTFDCPDDWSCMVNCDSTFGCDNTTVNCPMGGDCTVQCGPGTSPCEAIEVNCGDGLCDLTCDGTTACDGATMTCGSKDANIHCDVTSADVTPVDGGSGCACGQTGDCD